MSKFWVITLETFKRNVKSASFLVMLVSPILLLGVVTAIYYFSDQNESKSKIAVISQPVALGESMQSIDGFKINRTIRTKGAAEKALLNEKIVGYLTIKVAKNQQVNGTYAGIESLGIEQKNALQTSLSQLQLSLNMQQMELKPVQVERLLQPAEMDIRAIEIKDGKLTSKQDNSASLMLVAMVSSLFLFMIISYYSSITANEVASEKGTRIMEIILSSTSATTHFTAKLFGMFLLILTQLLVYAGVLVGLLEFAKNNLRLKSFVELFTSKEFVNGLFGLNLIFVILGILLYTTLAAFAASLVSKAEDASKAVTPIMLVSMVGYALGFTLGGVEPNSMIVKVFSYVPFMSSFMMPIRLANNSINNGAVWVSLLILVATTALLVWFSAKMYRSTALVYTEGGLLASLKRVFQIHKSEKIAMTK